MHIKERQSFLRLLNWLSPNLPLGAFNYSQGLESSIANGHLKQLVDLQKWIKAYMFYGAGWSDAVLLVRGWSVNVANFNDLRQINQFGLAYCSSAERYQEVTQLGDALLRAVLAWDSKMDRLKQMDALHYAVILGYICRCHQITLDTLLPAYLHSVVNHLCQASMRLMPVGQSQILSLLAELEGEICQLSERLKTTDLKDAGTSAYHQEITALQHEILQERMFCS